MQKVCALPAFFRLFGTIVNNNCLLEIVVLIVANEGIHPVS